MCTSCVPQVLYGLVCVENVAIALLRMCLMKSMFKMCYPSCDHRKTARNMRPGFSMQLRVRTISVGSVSSLLFLRTLRVGSVSSRFPCQQKLNRSMVTLATLNILSAISQHFPFRCAPGRLVIQRLHRTLATLPALSNCATLSKHVLFHCAPGRLVMRRYQIRFHHAIAIAYS